MRLFRTDAASRAAKSCVSLGAWPFVYVLQSDPTNKHILKISFSVRVRLIFIRVSIRVRFILNMLIGGVRLYVYVFFRYSEGHITPMAPEVNYK